MSDDPAEILVVCMGNICRSPFAEMLLREEAGRRLGGDAPVRVRSAGVRGLRGHPATTEMRAEAAERGLDLSHHRGAGVTTGMVADADLVLTMTEAQRDVLTRMAPAAASRTFTLKEFARLVEHVDAPADGAPRDRVRMVASRADEQRSRAPAAAAPEDVADPYGAARDVYRRTAEEISELVDRVAAHLFGQPPDDGQ